jgi:hypothetical protein
VGGLIQFPRNGKTRGDGDWHDPAEAPPNTLRATRRPAEVSLINWIETTRPRDDDDGDGGGSAA